MDEKIDWRGIAGGAALGLAAMVLGSLFVSRRRVSRSRSARVRNILVRSGILPKPRQAHIGPLAVPAMSDGIPEVFLRAFRHD